MPAPAFFLSCACAQLFCARVAPGMIRSNSSKLSHLVRFLAGEPGGGAVLGALFYDFQELLGFSAPAPVLARGRGEGHRGADPHAARIRVRELVRGAVALHVEGAEVSQLPAHVSSDLSRKLGAELSYSILPCASLRGALEWVVVEGGKILAVQLVLHGVRRNVISMVRIFFCPLYGTEWADGTRLARVPQQRPGKVDQF